MAEKCKIKPRKSTEPGISRSLLPFLRLRLFQETLKNRYLKGLYRGQGSLRACGAMIL